MSYTIKELAQFIGTTGEYNVSKGMWITVKIVDMRLTYGEPQAQIEPVAGNGSVWVMLSNVKAIKP
jgi:hypothetical protein